MHPHPARASADLRFIRVDCGTPQERHGCDQLLELASRPVNERRAIPCASKIPSPIRSEVKSNKTTNHLLAVGIGEIEGETILWKTAAICSSAPKTSTTAV